MGSGGTLAGVSEGLKQKNNSIKIGLSDPYGSSLYSYIKTNNLSAEGSSITEGIGTSRITKNFENTKVDFAYRIDDTNALNVIFNLLKNEGLCLGTSSGINVAGAIEMAKEMGPGKTIVTILCDVGSRSASKIFNVDFLKSKNFNDNSFIIGPMFTPRFLSILNLPVPELKSVIEKLKKKVNNNAKGYLKNSYENLIKFYSANSSTEDRRLFFDGISDMDARRRLDSRNIFKKLYKVMDDYTLE